MSDISPSQAIFQGLKGISVDFVASVPCINLQELLCLVDSDQQMTHIPVTREEEGVGICAGAWMGGRRPAILMQNSGLGNCINALASLNSLYGVPLLMIMSHRGCAGEPIVGQVPMGRLTLPLLEAMDIPAVAPRAGEGEEAVRMAWDLALERGLPAAVLLDLSYWRGEE